MSEKLRELFPCPGCSGDLSHHQSVLIASIIDDPTQKTRLRQFLRGIKSRNWSSDVLRFQEWEGGSDVVFLYALRCPDQHIILVLVRDPVELLDNKKIVGIEKLNVEDSRALFNLLGSQEWKDV